VSIALMVEVLDQAPVELTYAERYLLLALAEWANDEQRTCWPGQDVLQQRMRAASWDAVAKVLRSLAVKGYEVRVPIGGSPDAPTFAAPGRRTTYRVPRFVRSAKTADHLATC
jgi:hypothetical protein